MGDKIKAIGLFSGGLDSAIAARLMMNQHIEVIAVTFKTPFAGEEWALKMGNVLGLDVEVVECCDDYMEIVKRPVSAMEKHEPLHRLQDIHAQKGKRIYGERES